MYPVQGSKTVHFMCNTGVHAVTSPVGRLSNNIDELQSSEWLDDILDTIVDYLTAPDKDKVGDNSILTKKKKKTCKTPEFPVGKLGGG